MATKPTPGASDGTYGAELNAFLDESLAADGKIKTEALQTDSTAPIADAALANKKYVDDQITANAAVGDNPTINDSESNAMLKAQAYLTQTAGFVNAYVDSNASVKNLNLYVGTTTDPAGAGTLVDSVEATITGHRVSVGTLVGSGKYFELTTDSTNAVTITWTPIISGGAAPIDQD